jgi:hypothetical protein
MEGQGLGVSAGLGVYRSHSTYIGYGDPGVAGEVIGHWGFPSGFALGLGARAISFQHSVRGTAFVDARYAPGPSAGPRARPIVAVRLGPYIDDLGGDPLMGVEGGAALGYAFRIGAGVSLTAAADVVVVLSGNDYANTKRRFTPGLMIGVTFH